MLQVLGARGEVGALERAVAAFEVALMVYTREAAPTDWARTQENLALTFAAMADVEEVPKVRLEQALETMMGALEVYRAQDMSYNIKRGQLVEAWLWQRLAGLEGNA